VLTGCHANKFSLHFIIADRLYCDSNVLLMALVVFEVARAWVPA
jgi:hypothetical protein